MYFNVTNAKYVKDYQIRLDFEDGSNGVADLYSYRDTANVFRAFLDVSYFRNFKVEYGTLVWGNGEIDIAPETLYEIATGKPISYSAQHSNV